MTAAGEPSRASAAAHLRRRSSGSAPAPPRRPRATAWPGRRSGGRCRRGTCPAWPGSRPRRAATRRPVRVGEVAERRRPSPRPPRRRPARRRASSSEAAHGATRARPRPRRTPPPGAGVPTSAVSAQSPVAGLRLGPQVLPAEDVPHSGHARTRPAQGQPEAVGGEQRAVFVEEVPRHAVAEDPLDARRLDEHLRRPSPTPARTRSRSSGSRDVFDDVPADDGVGRDGGVRAVERPSRTAAGRRGRRPARGTTGRSRRASHAVPGCESSLVRNAPLPQPTSTTRPVRTPWRSTMRSASPSRWAANAGERSWLFS